MLNDAVGEQSTAFFFPFLIGDDNVAAARCTYVIVQSSSQILLGEGASG
jgi:hypothetical protein